MRRGTAALLALVVALVGCSDGGGDDDSAATPPADRPSTTTTTVPATEALVLGAERIGPVGLGTAEDQALATLTDALGPPESDNVLPAGSCSTGATRSVSWDDLNLFFGPGAGGDTDLVGWAYGTDELPAAPPAATVEGIGAGATRAELESAYGDRLEVTEDGDAGAVGFAIFGGGDEARIDGLLTGPGPDDTVRGLFAGSYCG